MADVLLGGMMNAQTTWDLGPSLVIIVRVDVLTSLSCALLACMKGCHCVLFATEHPKSAHGTSIMFETI